jgi:serine/threonine protein kinase
MMTMIHNARKLVAYVLGDLNEHTFSLQVAVKVLKPEIVEEIQDLLEAMRHEANVILNLGLHDNIMQLQGVVEEKHALVFPLYSRGSVDDAFRRGESFTPLQKLCIATGASAGLHHMHTERFLHRDVAARYAKITANTFVCGGGRSLSVMSVPSPSRNETLTHTPPATFSWAMPSRVC